MNEIKFNPQSGSNDKKVEVTGFCNPGLDFEQDYNVTTGDGSITRNVKIVHEGKREVFAISNNAIPQGENYFLAGFDKNSMSPDAAIKAKTEGMPRWDFYLIDTTRNTGMKSKPVGKLRKTNLLRFEDGSFAPTVGITEAQRAECDVDLYLSADGTQKYCNAGQFDAAAFYASHGMNHKLYKADGTEVRILRPWETTETKYTIGLACAQDLTLVDNDDRNGYLIRGVIVGQEPEDSIYGDKKRFPVLPPTAISPGPVCTIGNKTRSFFYDYEGEKNCVSSPGIKGYVKTWVNMKKTFPRVNDMQAYNNAKFARANNADPNLPYPFSEGGFFALNTYVSYLEMKYGTRYMHDAVKWGSGISSNNGIANDSQLNQMGGVKARKKGDTTWSYFTWSRDMTTFMNIDTNVINERYASAIFNFLYPKEQCMESQMAASYAEEMHILPGEEFEFYGGTYWYRNAVGDTDTEMNKVVYKRITDTYTFPDKDGNENKYEYEAVLRMSLYEGANLSGDIWRYWQGGYEMIGICMQKQEVSRYNNSVFAYLEPDQTKWLAPQISTISVAGDQFFPFEDKYQYLGRSLANNQYSKKRLALSGITAEPGGGLNSGESFYSYLYNYWGNTVGNKYRMAARFAGHASYGLCSSRPLDAALAVSIATRHSAGSAQTLLDVS